MNKNNKSAAPQIKAILTDALGKEMAERIIVGSCNILAVDEEDLFGADLVAFVNRMEIVVPAILGRKPAERAVKRLRELRDERDS